MGKSLRFGTALTAVGMIGAIAGCASPGAHIATRSSIFGELTVREPAGPVGSP